MRLCAATAKEIDAPAGTGEAGNGWRRGWSRRNVPAGEGGVRLGGGGAFGIIAPAPQGEGRNAGAFGCKLQAAGGDERQMRHLAHDPAKSAVPKRFLHRGQDLGVLPGLDIDDPVGMQADPGEGGREQVAASEAPEDRPLEPGETAANEERRGRDMFRFEPALGEFMQGAKRQPAPGEMRVNRLDPEGESRPLRPCRSVERDDPTAQIGQNGIMPGMLHALLERRVAVTLFLVCSHSLPRVNRPRQTALLRG